MTERTIGKLRHAFLMGCTDEEACIYAGINKDTLYAYQVNNPKFSDKKRLWKENPVLKARTTVFKSLDIAEIAQWFLERKKKDEFSTRQELGGAIDIPGLVQLGEDIKKILEIKKEGGK